MFKTRFISLLVLLITAVTGAWATITVTINQSDWGVNYSFTKDGVTVSAAYIDRDEGDIKGGGTFSTTLGNFTKIVVTADYCQAYGEGWSGGEESMTWAGTPASTVSFGGDFDGMGETQTTIVCTIEPATVASWVGNSAINANGTWYYAGENFGWCTGGAFNGADLGTITTLSLGGQSQAWAEGNANWNDGNLTMTMGYKIDGGADESLSLNWFEFADNNNKFQSGGSSWAAQDIDISGLAPGNHTIAVWFTRDDKWDSNNSANYVANFTIPTPAPTVVASGNCGTSGHESDVTWSLTDDGTLTISGTGAMDDFDYEAPWSAYQDNITSVVIEDGVTSVGARAFTWCSNLTSVSLPASLEAIGAMAFARCGLTSITLPASLETIGMRAFQDTKITSVNIPASVASIDELAFGYCGSLAEITVADGNTVYEAPNGCNALIVKATHTLIQGCNGTVFANLPADLKSIGEAAFAGCTSLTTVTFPDGLESIGGNAFESCSGLTTVTIPASVNTVDVYAFAWCDNLTTVTIYATSLTTYGEGAFDDAASGLKIYVPYGSGDTYKAGWADYASKIEEMAAPTTYDVTFADGLTGWTADPTTAAEGETITLNYTGKKKVKNITIEKAPEAAPAATVTTAPTAKTGVKAGQNEAIVNAGEAEGGTMMYAVTTDATQPASTDGFSATVPTAEGLTAGTYYVWYYVKADATHTDSEISATGIEVTIASAYTMAAAATSADKGKLICTDGHIHAYGADAACTATRVAKIIYIGTTGNATYSHGLALALTDETGTMAWQDAIDACSAKNTSTPVTGATWLQASYYQWGYMLGASGAGSYTALRDGFSSVGGDNLQSEVGYWSSTQSSDRQAYYFNFNKSDYFTGLKTYAKWVRACLAF